MKCNVHRSDVMCDVISNGTNSPIRFNAISVVVFYVVSGTMSLWHKNTIRRMDCCDYQSADEKKRECNKKGNFVCRLDDAKPSKLRLKKNASRQNYMHQPSARITGIIGTRRPVQHVRCQKTARSSAPTSRSADGLGLVPSSRSTFLRRISCQRWDAQKTGENVRWPKSRFVSLERRIETH